jgi:hypothetical protein
MVEMSELEGGTRVLVGANEQDRVDSERSGTAIETPVRCGQLEISLAPQFNLGLTPDPVPPFSQV